MSDERGGRDSREEGGPGEEAIQQERLHLSRDWSEEQREDHAV